MQIPLPKFPWGLEKRGQKILDWLVCVLFLLSENDRKCGSWLQVLGASLSRGGNLLRTRHDFHQETQNGQPAMPWEENWFWWQIQLLCTFPLQDTRSRIKAVICWSLTVCHTLQYVLRQTWFQSVLRYDYLTWTSSKMCSVRDRSVNRNTKPRV